jgi:hypothetical protein
MKMRNDSNLHTRELPNHLSNGANGTWKEPLNTPVFQDNCQPGSDKLKLKQLPVKLLSDRSSLVELSVASNPAQSCIASNEQDLLLERSFEHMKSKEDGEDTRVYLGRFWIWKRARSMT